MNSAASYEQRRECSREASIETISSTEFKQSIFPQRPDLHPSPNQSRARSDTASRCPNFAGAANDSGISMIKPQTRLSNPSPNQVAIFRDSQGPYQSEGITHGKRKHRATAQGEPKWNMSLLANISEQKQNTRMQTQPRHQISVDLVVWTRPSRQTPRLKENMPARPPWSPLLALHAVRS